MVKATATLSALTQDRKLLELQNSTLKVDLSIPKIAWLTVLLFLGCTILWLSSLLLSLYGVIPLGLGMVLSTIASFASFTPMHDGSHRSISRLRWVNETIGRIMSILLFVPFLGLRYVHMEHHQNTNDKQKDPDYWSGLGPSWKLPLRWLSQDLHYFTFYLKRLAQRPRFERWESFLTLLLLGSAVLVLCLMGYTKPVLMLWVLPARIAIFLLAYSFDYLPHKPHTITSAEDRYKATVIRPSWVLTPILFYQNYHLIHHLYPGVPFYRYAHIWRSQKELLLSKGVITYDLLGHIPAK